MGDDKAPVGAVFTPNAVTEGIGEAIKKYGRSWVQQVRFDDYVRVRTELMVMMRWLDDAWGKEWREQVAQHTQAIEDMEAKMEVNRAAVNRAAAKRSGSHKVIIGDESF